MSLFAIGVLVTQPRGSYSLGAETTLLGELTGQSDNIGTPVGKPR